jgi:AraC family ethanolamine operon transcriptional activator
MRQFEDKVKERIDTVVRIPELCTELNVSKRTLEYLVKEEIGMTPKQFSNVLRLNAVRRELLKRSTENQTINQIARHFGITHPGRFADAYMGQFGELPSDTLR